MGYTHYWTQRRDFTKAEWQTILEDIGAILKYAQHDAGIPLANGNGDDGSKPEIDASRIWFNGLGDDSHETMAIDRVRPEQEEWQTKRGFAFCKTAQKPYDAVVVACLCYLSTITRRDNENGEPILGSEAYSISSDGDGNDFLSGLDLARKALPAKANMLDLPMAVMQSDRWCAPWINNTSKSYEVRFCIDGKGYVMSKRGASYCFESHMALAKFLESTKRVAFNRDHIVAFNVWRDNYKIEQDIWNATGSFDPARHARIAKAQEKALAKLFPVDPACAQQPPAFVRPGDMPDNAGRQFCYSIADLLKLAS